MEQQTKYWSEEETRTGLIEAAAVLADGGVIAFPTETVYGLGGDARSTRAVERIFTAKGRPSDNPLIVHLADVESVHLYAERVNEVEAKLISAFWPGALTLVLPVRAGAVSPLVTAGLDTVAIRVPAHALALQLIAASGCPLAAPSANRSGRPSPTEARHVLEDLTGRIDGVLDGGATGVGLESTVVRVVDGVVHILRPGGITREQLVELLGEAALFSADDSGEPVMLLELPERVPQPDELARISDQADPPRSPGVKYTHYAPRGELLLVTGLSDRLSAVIQQRVNAARNGGRRAGVISCTEHITCYDADAVLDCGPRNEPEQAARRLYALLRECDELKLDFIAAEGYPELGIGAALMNRMRKAAGGNEIRME